MDWNGARYEAEWVYRRVSWETWAEMEDYPRIYDGSFSKSLSDSLKCSGSMSFDGEPPNEVDLVRAYYSFTDGNRERAFAPVATVLVEGLSPAFSSLASGGAMQSGPLKAYSVLKVLSDKKCYRTLVIKSGTNAVSKITEIVQAAGLRIDAPVSDYLTNEDKIFEPNDSMLTVANWLADVAGFDSLRTDAYGTVILAPKQEPTERPVAWTFRNDGTSTMGFGVVEENDWRSVPNVYTLKHAANGETLIATVRNVDPNSKASLPNRGWRENGLSEDVAELEGSTTEERLANLEVLAVSRIKSKSAEVKRAKFSTFYVPIDLNDAVAVEYSDRTWLGSVSDMTITANPAGDTEIQINQFIAYDLQVEVESEIL